MFVVLAVADERRDIDKSWALCCGAYCHVVFTEEFLGDQDLTWADAERKHFPHFNHSEPESLQMSRAWLAAVTLGSTGWSGFNEETESYWRCTYHDLTEDGRKLWRMLERLYPGCAFYLLTFLDT